MNNNTEEYATEKDPLQQNETHIPPDHKSKESSFRNALRNITVEPSLIMFVSAFIVSNLTTQNLTLEKACRVNLNYTDDICNSLKLQEANSQNEHERETQKLLASALSLKTYLVATIPGIMSIFVGSWSDKTGRRKVFLIIALIGQCLTCINNMLNTYFFYETGVVFLALSEAIIEGITGGWCICLLITFSYIGAITTEETRTFRLGIVNFCTTVGIPVGMLISGILLKKLGYFGGYGLAASMHTVNVIYNLCYVKDPPRTKEQKKHDNQGIKHFFCTFFDLTNVKDAVTTVFRSGPNHRRLRMFTLLIVESLVFGPFFGEIAILYMSTRYRFNWDEVNFSMFQAYNFITHTAGTMISIIVFSKMWRWDDSVLGINSSVSKIAASFLYCFATTGRIFYLAPAVEILNGTAILAIKSIISKSVASDELGKVNSIFGLVENTMPLVYVPLYTKVYSATIQVMPGAVFLMGAIITIPAAIAFFVFWLEHRRTLKKAKQSEAHDHINNS